MEKNAVPNPEFYWLKLDHEVYQIIWKLIIIKDNTVGLPLWKMHPKCDGNKSQNNLNFLKES